MTDKFPACFKRFEKTVDIENLKFSDVVREFATWQGHRTTDLQEQCLKREIKGTPLSFYKQEIKYTYGNRNVFRDRKSGKFTNSKGEFKLRPV